MSDLIARLKASAEQHAHRLARMPTDAELPAAHQLWAHVVNPCTLIWEQEGEWHRCSEYATHPQYHGCRCGARMDGRGSGCDDPPF